MSRARIGWIAAAIVVYVGMFVLATNDAVYELTSPSALSWHVALRKLYSIGAFALVGFVTTRALGITRGEARRMAVLVALYSALIEVVQRWDGSHEGLRWNAFDIACGAVGGALAGAFSARLRSARADREPDADVRAASR